MFRLGTLFSGIGSPEFGLDKLNIKYISAFACEIDHYARKSFLANHNIDKKIFFKDVYKIEEKDIEKDIDLLVAGFPCQTFSSAGKG